MAASQSFTAEAAPAPEAPLDEAPLVDALFTQMALHPPVNSSVRVAAPPPPAAPSLNLELDERPAKAAPSASELEEMVILDEASEAEPVVSNEEEDADALMFHDEEPVEIVDEVGDEEVLTPTVGRMPRLPAASDSEEVEVVEEETEPVSKTRSAPKKSRKGLLIGCLVGGLVLGLLGCGGIGFALYRYLNDEGARRSEASGSPSISGRGANPVPILIPGPGPNDNPSPVVSENLFPDRAWRRISPPGSRCSFEMPGDPKQFTQPEDAATHFQLDRQAQGCVFEVAYFDLPVGQDPSAFLDVTMAGVEKQLLETTGGKTKQNDRMDRPGALGRQLVITGTKGETYLTRLYVTMGHSKRVYQLQVQGAKIRADGGDAVKFLNLFKMNP